VHVQLKPVKRAPRRKGLEFKYTRIPTTNNTVEYFVNEEKTEERDSK
jgi:hypothetical protein